MTMSWHTMMEFEPPLIGCVISNRNYSYRLLKSGKCCVINIPSVEIAQKVVGCGNCSGADVDKFSQFGLNTTPATTVDVPMLDACFANIECQVIDTKMVNRYGFFVLEVKQAWINPRFKNPKTMHHQGFGRFMIAGERISLKSAMR